MTVTRLRSELQGSRDALFAAIRGLSEEQFRYAPAGDGWSVAAHLAHLLRIERVFSERAHAAIVEDEPYVASTRVANDDDPGLSQKLAVPQIIHGMLNARRELVDVLSDGGEAVLDRSILHERIGRMSVREIAVKMAEHEREHAAEVVKLVRQAPTSGRVIVPSATLTRNHLPGATFIG